MPKTKSNQHCPCGSAIKYKKCCMSKDHSNKAAQEEKEQDILHKFMQKEALVNTNQRINKLKH